MRPELAMTGGPAIEGSKIIGRIIAKILVLVEVIRLLETRMIHVKVRVAEGIV